MISEFAEHKRFEESKPVEVEKEMTGTKEKTFVVRAQEDEFPVGAKLAD